ncbi:MAG: hypothetical protein IJT54_03680 [Candidatus Methanomethylophilaceae archaeon]|nr:hypothetical protein [Candidatus Methanomethylophilaceae archaeon]
MTDFIEDLDLVIMDTFYWDLLIEFKGNIENDKIRQRYLSRQLNEPEWVDKWIGIMDDYVNTYGKDPDCSEECKQIKPVLKQLIGFRGDQPLGSKSIKEKDYRFDPLIKRLSR